MPDAGTSERGTARGCVSFLDAVLYKIQLTGNPLADKIVGMRGRLLSALADRRSAGVAPYESFNFVFPIYTESVSSTGNKCALNCAHCGGHYLAHMTPASELRRRLGRERDNYKSWLISGGCDARGRVPMMEESLLRDLAARGPLNFHVGLAGPRQMAAVSRFAEVVSFDMIGSDETIFRVTGLKNTVEDYLSTYERLKATGVPVVPHVVVGLDAGRIRGEMALLEELSRRGVSALVFLVLRPTPGTAFADVDPPALDEVADVFLRARSLLPAAQINLGCMRPSGRYREALDLVAAACDLDVLVQPTREVRRVILEASDAEVGWGDQCCALYHRGGLEPEVGFSDWQEFNRSRLEPGTKTRRREGA